MSRPVLPAPGLAVPPAPARTACHVPQELRPCEVPVPAAERADQYLRGFDEWVTVPLAEGEYEVTHCGETCRFRPIVNGKRQPWRRVQGRVCSACGVESPVGATMYVPAKDDPRRTRSLWGGRRLCSTCVRSELAVAVLGTALAGSGGAR